MALQTFLFYAFAATVLGSALMVISLRNPVHSVLFLIFAFFNTAGLFILLKAEFMAMLLVIVYVGAVAVLFLFVVMMLDINYRELRKGFLRYLPIGLLLAGVLFAELFLVLKQSADVTQVVGSVTIPSNVTNTEAIGQIVYTDYLLPFQISGLILLIAMVGAIVLTLRVRPNVRKQTIAKQVHRKQEDCVTLVSARPGEGV